jgi:hypothetical protein
LLTHQSGCWYREDISKRGQLAEKILNAQRHHGGWAQLPGLDSDAWATAQALTALRKAKAISVNDPAYRRGAAFLLRTQFADGSWFVRSRTWPFQPYFNSQFPHGKHQWISAAGTAWATLVLLESLEAAAPQKASHS